ncbi:MAG: YCF48-related protein [Halioglobus sp.]
MVTLYPKIVGSLALLLLPMAVLAENALHMPLASKSLLLDIVIAENRLVVVGERGHILLSDDAGNSWRQAHVPTRQMLTAVHFSSPSLGWAVGHDGMILATVDAGENWAVQRNGLQAQRQLNQSAYEALRREQTQIKQTLLAAQSPQNRQELQLQLEDLELDLEDAELVLHEEVHAPPLLDVYFSSDSSGIAVGAFNTLLLTDDGGASWQHASSRLNNPEEYHLNGIAGDAQGNYWIAGEGGVLFRSNNFGASWQKLPSPYAGSWFGVDLSPRSARLLIFGLRGNVYHSDDAGDSWERSKVSSNRSIAGGGFFGERHVMLVGSVGTFLVSEDDGNSFNSRSLGPRVNLSAVAFAGGHTIAVGQSGVRTAQGIGEEL